MEDTCADSPTSINGLGGVVAVGGNVGGGTIVVTVNESVAAHNGSPTHEGGFAAESLPGKAVASMFVNRSAVVSNPGVGLFGAGATVAASESLIFKNGVGWTGTIVSAGNNVIQGNAAGEGPMPTFLLR
jgi:hypothetical protein